MSEPYLKKVSFDEMLRRDEMIICDHPLLMGIGVTDWRAFKEPMHFDDFLKKLVSQQLTSLNLKCLFAGADWYIWTTID